MSDWTDAFSPKPDPAVERVATAAQAVMRHIVPHWRSNVQNVAVDKGAVTVRATADPRLYEERRAGLLLDEQRRHTIEVCFAPGAGDGEPLQAQVRHVAERSIRDPISAGRHWRRALIHKDLSADLAGPGPAAQTLRQGFAQFAQRLGMTAEERQAIATQLSDPGLDRRLNGLTRAIEGDAAPSVAPTPVVPTRRR